MAGRYLNELKMYPNRALQSAGEENCNYVNEAELRSQLAATTTQIEVVQYSASSQELSEYYENTVVVDIDSIIRIALSTQTQSTNEWKIHRSMRITASSAYTLFTYLKNKNPDWHKKLSQYWDTKNLNVKATKYGKDTEPLAFECYKLKHNSHVKRCGLVIHPVENWMAGSPDGIDCKSSVLLEIKCPGHEHLSLDEIMETPSVRKYIKTNAEDEISLKQNHLYYCQVQINMWILNCPTCDFIIYSKKDNDFCKIEVPFDVTYTSNIVNCLKKLYFDRMLTMLCSSHA